MSVASPSLQPSSQLHRQLAAVRRKQILVKLGSGLAVALVSLVLLVGAQMLADWWFELPWVARAVLLLADLVLLGTILYQGVWQPLRHPLSTEAAALLVEQHHPELHSRLIAAVQLPASSEGQRAAAIVGRLIAQTEQQLAPVDCTRAVSARHCWRHLVLALLVAALGALVWQRAPTTCLPLLQRALLATIPVPRKTRVECLSGDLTLARGDNARLEARAHGVLPQSGTLELQYDSGRAQNVSLAASTQDRTRFGRDLVNVLESFTYRIRLNDGVSGPHRVQVEPPPSLADLKCVQIPPAYTGLPSGPRALGDLVLLAGSRLQLRGTATKPLESAQLRLLGTTTETSLAINSNAAHQLGGEFQVRAGLSGFAVRLQDQRGLRSRDEVLYRVEVVPDRVPAVSLTHPTRREELVTAAGQLLVGFEASDDFGIDQVQLVYKLANSDAPHAINLDLEGQRPRTLRRRYEWHLAKLEPPLAEGSSLEYWLEARDGNDVTGPGRGQSEHFHVRVVSVAEKRADLAGRLDEFLGTLGGVADTQQRLSEALGGLIRHQPPGR